MLEVHDGPVTDGRTEREIATRRIERESKVRGMLLGLALGDAVETATPPTSVGWRGSATTQLACFVTDGVIRAAVRASAKGICHPPMVMWHALARWSVQQRLDLPVAKQWRNGTSKSWPDGWLAPLEVLSRPRGTARRPFARSPAGAGPRPLLTVSATILPARKAITR